MALTKIVEITWIDSCSVTDWIPAQEAMDTKPMVCTSVGYILGKDDESVVICGTMADVGDVNEVTCIPATAIQEIRELG